MPLRNALLYNDIGIWNKLSWLSYKGGRFYVAFDFSDQTDTSGLRSTNWSKIYYPEYLMVRDRRLIMTEIAWVKKVCVGVSHDNLPDVRIILGVCTT